MKRIREFVLGLLATGVEGLKSEHEIKKVRIANGINLIGGLSIALAGIMVLIYFPISIPGHSFAELLSSTGYEKQLLSNEWNILYPVLDIFMGLLGVFNVYLNHKKKYGYAFFITGCFTAIFVFALTLFIGLRVSYFLLLTSIIPMLFYDKAWQYAMVWALNIGLFIVAALFIDAYGAIFITPTHLLFKSTMINMIPAFVILFLIINHFKVENDRNEKVLLESNDLLRLQTQEIKEQHEEIKEHNAELSELNATKDKFFSIIAHDLRNPFTALIGFSELLYENALTYTPEKVRHVSKTIAESANQTFTLIENLLDWSRLQRGIMKVNAKNLMPSELVQQAILLCERDAQLKNIELTSEIAFDETFAADEEMIKAVLRNLISNAIKFTHPKGKVLVKTQRSGNHLVVSVSDTGVGIAKEKLNRLFNIDGNTSEPGTANEKGTGLGLILCKEFTELHKGKIWVDSEVGKGSRFSFSLPCV